MKICDICEHKQAKHRCPVCGRSVCNADYDYEKGICRVCSETLCEICGRYPSIGYCMICGRSGCEDCLIQVTLVSYVCKECIGRGRYRLEA